MKLVKLCKNTFVDKNVPFYEMSIFCFLLYICDHFYICIKHEYKIHIPFQISMLPLYDINVD
jgi:hypothetical protein